MKTIMKTTGWLVMAAALTFGFASCSSDDDAVAGQNVNPAQQTYTMIVSASKGDDADTRALGEPRQDPESGKNMVDVFWSGNEKIDVVGFVSDGPWEVLGTATAAPSNNSTTTLTVTLNKVPDLMRLCLGGHEMDWTRQVGLLTGDENSISEKYDYALGSLDSKDFTVDGSTITPTDGASVHFQSEQAIVKFTLVDKADNAPIYATSLTIHSGDAQYLRQSYDIMSSSIWDESVYGDIDINRSASTNVIYAALSDVKNTPLTLTATDVNYTYTYEKSDVTFEHGKYYEITVKMTKRTATYTAPTLPTGSSTFTDTAQNLLASNGLVEDGHGTMYYSYRYKTIDGSYGDWSDWSTDAPTGTDAGVYEVKYKVEPATGYAGIGETSLGSFTINKIDWTGKVSIEEYNEHSNKATYEGDGSVLYWYRLDADNTWRQVDDVTTESIIIDRSVTRVYVTLDGDTNHNKTVIYSNHN